MAINPVLVSGMIQRTDDVGVLKHQQDVRPAVEQQNAQTQVSKRVEENRRQVITPEDTNKANTHADAREEGKNKYFFRRKNNKKGKKEETTEDKVIKKNTGSSFDMKV